MTDNERQFAHGAWKVGGCECPALSAGFELLDVRKTFIEWFDIKVTSGETARRGVVSEERAKEAWLEVIEEVDDNGLEEFGRTVASELGWI